MVCLGRFVTTVGGGGGHGDIFSFAKGELADTNSTTTGDGGDGGLRQGIPLSRVRNFSIIAHVDHGKSSLADKILELAGNREAGVGNAATQSLDTLKVERERGITVKAQTASMLYRSGVDGEQYLLNLVDTPGHVDFAYEVSRSLQACQGALLLVDAGQGVQAQTYSTFDCAASESLALVPVMTKIDLPHAAASLEEVALGMASAFDFDPDAIIATSAKTGLGVQAVCEAIVEGLPPPSEPTLGPLLQCRIIDSHFNTHRGVVCVVQVVGGVVAEGERIQLCSALSEQQQDATDGPAAGRRLSSVPSFSVQEVGVLCPQMVRTGRLAAGQVGYIICGMRSTTQARIGDTVVAASPQMSPHEQEDRLWETLTLPGFEMPRNMVFASLYPIDNGNFEELRQAVERLCLNDASVSVAQESGGALGFGLRCGFLGLLHMEVFHQRLIDEFGMPVMMTTPTVPFEVVTVLKSSGDDPGRRFQQGRKEGKSSSSKRRRQQLGLSTSADDATMTVDAETGCMTHRRLVQNVADFPEMGKRKGTDTSGSGAKVTVFEPMVLATVVCDQEHTGALMDIMLERRGVEQEMKYLDGGDSRVMLRYLIPWQEVVTDFHDVVKNVTAGYASFTYEEADPSRADVVKVAMCLNGENVDALSFVCHRSKAESRGRALALRLKGVIDRQQFEINIQAKIGSRIVAKERIPPFRKDVLTKSGKTVGGGDVTRKKKLLEKQKQGKKRLKTVGSVPLSQSAFWSVMAKT